MNKNYERSFKSIKKDRIKMARDLCYGPKVIQKLEAAENENELTKIMREARKEKMDAENI